MKIFAHRGFSSKYPENTMIAYKKALEAGAHGIEIDVQFSKDQEVVVIHDLKLDRTTNGKGYVKDFTLKELKGLKADYKFVRLCPTRIPTLIEVFTWLKTNELDCIIEMKNLHQPYEGLEEAVISLIKDFGLEERVSLSSFNHNSLKKCQEIAPHLPIAPLFQDGIYEICNYAKGLRAAAIHPHYLIVNKQILQNCRKNKIDVRPFTVNKREDIEGFIRLNAPAIITDNVKLALELSKSKKNSF